MTRKETLYSQKHELYNQLRALQGLDAVEMPTGYHYNEAIKNARVYDLEEDIEKLQAAIQGQTKENEIKARTEEFYATPEGQAYKDSLNRQLDLCYTTQEKLTEEQLHNLNALIQNVLGERWAVKRMSTTSVDFGRRKADDSDYIFGSAIEIRADISYFGEGERFETNVGTMGSFDLQSEDPNSRRQFYIDLGTLLADTAALDRIKQLIFMYRHQMDSNQESARTLHKKIANPLGL